MGDLDFEAIDKFFTVNSYVTGYSASTTDLVLFNEIKKHEKKIEKYLHLKRWFYHLKSFKESELQKSKLQDITCILKSLSMNDKVMYFI